MVLRSELEDKTQKWMQKVVRYKKEEECQSKAEKDFWQNILPMFNDSDG